MTSTAPDSVPFALGALADPSVGHDPIVISDAPRERLCAHLERMVLIRRAEEQVADLVTAKEAECPCHLAIGQEACAVGVATAFKPGDRAFGAHRSHSHYLALGGDIDAMFAEILGRATGWTEGRGEKGPTHIRALAIQGPKGEYYRFLFVAPQAQAGRWAKPFRQSGLSFRRISKRAAAKVRAYRLLVVPARADDTIAGLARTLPYGRLNEAWFRVLNDLAPNQGIKKNQRLKIVAG